MKLELKRKEVIDIIKNYYIMNLSLDERGNVLIANGIEDIGDEVEGWNESEIMKYEYNILIYEQYDYGELITNKYLELLVLHLYKVNVIIIDSEPVPVTAIRCVCCGYKTAFEREGYSICPVCSWEDDFSGEDDYSHPNHSTLKVYREKFSQKKSEDPDNLVYKMFHR